MSTHIFIKVAALAVVGAVLSAPAQSPSGSTPSTPPSELAEMLKLGEPAVQHRELDLFVGQWDQTVKLWVRPDAPPIESTMSAEYEWVLDRRFVHGRFSGTLLGRPFQGFEIRGYDTATACYTLQWMDNMGTAALLAAGRFDPQSRVFSMSGISSACGSETSGHSPVVKFRTATHLVGTDRMIFEIFSRPSDGREFRSLQVISARRAP